MHEGRQSALNNATAACMPNSVNADYSKDAGSEGRPGVSERRGRRSCN